MKNTLSLITLLLFSLYNNAQSTFEKTFGGSGSDAGYDLTGTKDGGFAITGYSYSYSTGLNDCYLVKTDGAGNFQWQKNYGGSNGEFGLSISQDLRGNYIIAGTTLSYGEGSNDYYLIKTNSQGDTIWTKTYGGWLLDSPRDFIITSDSGYAMIGRTQSFGSGSSSVYFVKTDSAGNELFSKTYGGSNLNWGQSIVQTTDGGFIIAGKTSSFNAQGQDIYLIKTDANGDTLWTKYWGSAGDDWANKIRQTADGGYLICGTYNYVGASGDVYIAKTNSLGVLQWSKTYGGIYDDFANAELLTSDNKYLFAGATKSKGAGNFDLWLLKTDTNGDTLWTKTYGGTGIDLGYSLVETSDGGYAIAGATNSKGNGSDDVYLIKTNSSGSLTGTFEYGQSPISHIIYPNPFNDKAKIVIIWTSQRK